jgi:hypothetical protein
LTPRLRRSLSKSQNKGIPYQTLINSVLKKYVDGKLIDSSYEEMISELKKEIRALKKGA